MLTAIPVEFGTRWHRQRWDDLSAVGWPDEGVRCLICRTVTPIDSFTTHSCNGRDDK